MAERVGQQWGQYRLLQLLGKGSFAEVYLAEHGHSGTRIAIKILNTTLVRDDFEPFRSEASTISQLSHAHILRLLDFGVERGVPYLVMQYAPGGTLRRHLPQHMPLSPATILPFIEQTASALQYAHDRGVVHRNLKPENVLLNAQAEALLSDFSIAVLEQKTRYQATQDGGAAAYMAPEQIRGHALPASDQYALGLMIYEWLSGARPFEGTLRDILTQHLNATPPPLREQAPHVSAALEGVVMKALEKDPRGRYPSISAFAQAFRLNSEEPQPTSRRPAPFTAPPLRGSGEVRPPAPTPPLSRERSSFGGPSFSSGGPSFSPPAPPFPPAGPPARESGSLRPSMPMMPPMTPPAPGRGTDAVQRPPARSGPLMASNPGGGFAPPVQRASFPASAAEGEQRYSSGVGPPALRPGTDLAPTGTPRRRNPSLLVMLGVLALIVALVSGLGVLGANGSGPLAGLFTSSGGATPGSNSTGALNGANGRNCNRVGVLLPDTNSSSRWEAYDHPLLFQQLEANGFSSNNIDYANANGDATVQEAQAKADLSNGDCILIIAAQDSTAAAAIVEAARKQQVPVIAYDRLIFSDDLNYYVSFDGVEVGKLQGQYIADHYKEPVYGVGPGHNNIAFIDGSPTDNNATLFAEGAHDALDPLINAGILKKVYEQFTPNWDPPTAKLEIQTALANTNNNIQLILSANDDMGGQIIAALQAVSLAGKVLVTGQDATVGGLQRILEGTQAMTVYKPILKEATAAAQLAAAIRDGKNIATLTKGETIKNPNGKAEIPSVLETPIAVDRSNMASTVIADGYVTAAQVCNGLPPGTNTEGICS